MKNRLDLVIRLNNAARAVSVVPYVDQFENISTHAQYGVPYAITVSAIRSGDRTLDWGCGNGHFSFFLESLGAQVTGYSYEPPPPCMAGSQQFQFVAGTDGDPCHLPFPDASFDAVVGVGVLEHVWETGGNERVSLAELARIVKPGGRFLTFHLPNQSGWVEKVVSGLRMKKHFHHRKYEQSEIQTLWTEAGFEILQVRAYNALPRAELRRLPGFLRHSKFFAAWFGAVDGLLCRWVPWICTNFAVEARRKS